MLLIEYAEQQLLRQAVFGVMKAPTKARSADIPLALLRLAVDIDRRLPTFKPDGYRNAMPAVVHTAEEKVEAEAQRQIDLADGDPITGRNLPSGAELELLETVDRVFRRALREHADDVREARIAARDPNIDFNILWHLAAGKSQRDVAKMFKMHQPQIAYLKRKRLGTIWKQIEHLAPATVTRQPAPAGIRATGRNAASAKGFTYYLQESRSYRGGRERAA